MPEEQNVKGSRWEQKIIEIIKALGWKPRGDKNIDVYSAAENKEYGLDIYATYYDPFEDNKIGVFISAKNYKWQSIKPSFLKSTVNNLVEKVENVPQSADFNRKLNFNEAEKVNTGWILIWVNDENYIREKFHEYLEKIDIPSKWSSQRIFIASNDEILRYCSILDIKKQINNEIIADGKTFMFHNPSLTVTNKRPKRLNHLILEQLYSRFIFGRFEYRETIGNNRIMKKVLVIINSDLIHLFNLKLMYSSLIKYQLLDEINEIRIYFYDILKNFRSDIEEFKKYMNSEVKDKYKDKQIDIKYIQMRHFNNIFAWSY